MIPHILTIAGSDPSGGAGIQADLKTFSALGCYGMSVITALTAQNTTGVTAIHEVPPLFVRDQIDAIFSDIRVDAVKIGMAGSVKTIEVIAQTLLEYKPAYVVLDPVMVSQSGNQLISDDAIKALKKYLLPLADIVTPNIPEATILIGKTPSSLEEAAQQILSTGASAVLVKGGHGKGENSNDLYMDRYQTLSLNEKRIKTENNHGTGCTLSAAIACYLAKGLPEAPACQAAKKYITAALKHADRLSIGKGAGPVHHFYDQWD